MSRATLDPICPLLLSPTGLSPSLAGLSRTVRLESAVLYDGPNPRMHAPGFGLFPVRSPLLRKSILFFFFLRLLRCFSSPGSLRTPMDSVHGDWSLSSRVSPFRHPWIKGYLLLPMAFRSLSRLSSALSAKASTLRPYWLDLPI